MQRIESTQNKRFKTIRSLNTKKYRSELSLFIAEGLKVVATAMENGWAPKYLVMTPDAQANDFCRKVVQWGEERGAMCLETPPALLALLSTAENPPDIIGVFEQKWMPPEQAIPGDHQLWLALEEIRDAGNLGTIIRTVDAVGGAGIILAGDCCDAYSTRTVRATMGAIFSVPLVRMDKQAFHEKLKAWPGEKVGTHLAGAVDFRRAYRRPVLLVMGTEGHGLSPEVTAICDQLVKIPMVGKSDSLNLSIATALMLFEINREQLGRLDG
ncbi:MAG: RNA methyltransferase [Rhodospirillaceae bacterium]|nr:RNA methyltransferase [Rhodospirillaceae bacterium]